MTKRAKKERELKSNLRQRVADIAVGAVGYDFDNEDEFVPALKIQLGVAGKISEDGAWIQSSNYFLFDTHNLSNYNNIQSSTDFLFEYGVRA